MRVLVVDDEPLIAASIEWELRDAGHEVLGPAYRVEDALALAAAAGAQIDLALVDINLAGHDEGVGLARALSRRFGVPSVFVTGQVAQARSNRDAALGVVQKPFPHDGLLKVLPVAKELAGGGRPRKIPSWFEVFGDPTRPQRGAAAALRATV